MVGQSPSERLRQIARRLRFLPEHPAYRDGSLKQGDVHRRAGKLFDEAVILGAFAGPEHEALHELIDRAHHFNPDGWETIVWMEAIGYLCPDLREESGIVGALVPACEPIADAIDREAEKLEALEPEAADKGRARRECFNRAVSKFHGRVTTLAGEIDQYIRQRGIAAVASHPWILKAFELVNDVVDEVLESERRAAEFQLKSLKVPGDCDSASVYSEEQEEKLRRWVSDTLRRFPERILRECHRLCGQPGDLEDLAEKVESEVTYRIRREYSERRDAFRLEVETAKLETELPSAGSGDKTPETTVGPPAQPKAKSRRVTLFRQSEEPLIDGRPKDKLTTPQYNVVQTLIEAGYDGLTKDDLAAKSGHSDARGILKRLAERDTDWAAVIRFPGETGKRYRIE